MTDMRESGLMAGMQTWKDHLEQSMRKVQPKRSPVNGESIKTANTHKSGASTGLNDVFGSPECSDLTIRCGPDEYKLHCAIFLERFCFFARARDGDIEKSTITLQEDDPPTVRRMLTYLYTSAYDDEGDPASAQHYMVNGMKAVTPQAPTTKTTPLLADEHLIADEQLRHIKLMNNVVVYAVAEKYNIDELQELASAKFCELLRLKVSNHGLPSLIYAVFGTSHFTDTGLCNGIIEYCTQHSKRILADICVCSSIRDHGELGLGMLQQMLEEKRQLSRQIKQLQGCEKVQQGFTHFPQLQDMKARLVELKDICRAESMKNFGKASSPSIAQESLKRLRKTIKHLYQLAGFED